MFERFTERARTVIVHAQESARSLKHDYIGTEHLIVGLLRDPDSLGCKTLHTLGLTAEVVTADIERIVGRGDKAPEGQIPFPPRSKRVLELALREALSLGHNYIGTEHILLGLVREFEGVGARILQDHEIEPQKVRDEIIRALSGPARPKPQPTVAVDLMRIGDNLQSEASRVAEYLKGEKLPYEVAQSVFAIEAAVAQWTEARRQMGVQRVA